MLQIGYIRRTAPVTRTFDTKRGGTVSDIQRVGDLEIDQSLEFQYREWKVERVGWILMALVISGALLGFFGGAGPFSTGSVEGGGATPFRLEYYRFGRFKSQSTLRVQVAPGVTRADTVAFWISQSFLRGVTIDQVTPAPKSVEVGPERMTYIFSAVDSSEPVEIVIRFTLEEIGTQSGRLGLVTGPPVEFHQFVYP